jgi:mannan endo-1,4-beta-mannosidase
MPQVYYLLHNFDLFLIFFLAEAKRQFDLGIGSAFDGSSGVDTEDIINIPQIGYGSFQLFPDQDTYGPSNPNIPAFNNTVQQGLSWIQTHTELGQT